MISPTLNEFHCAGTKPPPRNTLTLRKFSSLSERFLFKSSNKSLRAVTEITKANGANKTGSPSDIDIEGIICINPIILKIHNQVELLMHE